MTELCQIPGGSQYHLSKRVYASMIPEAVKEGKTVLVRDIPLTINTTEINAHFGTPNYPELKKGYKIRHDTKVCLAMALRGTDDDVWEPNHLLKQSELPQELEYTRIDIGPVIMKAILEATSINMHPKEKSRSIIFPSLITIFPKKERVPEISTDEIKINPIGDLNKRSWQDVTIKTKGKKKQRITEGQSSTPSEEGLEFEFGKSKEKDQDYKDSASQSMLAKILSTVEGIRLGMTDLKDNLQQVMS
ncbi:hypothetical protein Ddye_019584 [Dipteronia dyeriana]|uniref:Uncharacterized protein n=1 Tax=Dipteronia dyeriana TaxID=168575 RepID=A0AAD9TZ55_9ROSI|nr:hypothetical protein Ddye_019584 [Dipteronia dyeriana]